MQNPIARFAIRSILVLSTCWLFCVLTAARAPWWQYALAIAWVLSLEAADCISVLTEFEIALRMHPKDGRSDTSDDYPEPM